MDPHFLKRPTSDETDEDLMRMQEEWAANREKKAAVEIHRMKKRQKNEVKAPEAPKLANNHGARFTIELDDIKEESDVNSVLFGVQEKNQNWLSENMADEMSRFQFLSTFSKDDGFPETMNLSAYYCKNAPSKRIAPPGKSFFAAEFDRIHGNIDTNLDENLEEVEEEETTKKSDFEKENEQYLASLDTEKIMELKSEIEERLDPKLMAFLANRRKLKKEPETEAEKPKISKFKSRRIAEKSEPSKVGKVIEEPVEEKPVEKEAKSEEMLIEDMLNELEVLDEFSTRQDREKYDRLATDAIQLDLTAKFGRNVVSRQQKNAVKLFDSCKYLLKGYDGSDKLLETARSQIEEIKKLYLEEVEVQGQRMFEFAKGVNPILDACWTLVPARRVLDAVEKRQGQVLEDDVEIVRLALLWTLLLFEERKSAFFAFAQPNDMFVYLSEVFLIGYEILADDVIVECCSRLIDKYLIKAAIEGRINLRMNTKVAGLDAFMPLYENLLKNYEQYSLGNVEFAKIILMIAYLNAPIGDSIEYQMALWSPKLKIVRQLMISNGQGREMLESMKTQSLEREASIDDHHYIQYITLLGLYVVAIRDNVITRDRNELMFSIASHEIGRFVKRHEEMRKTSGNEEKMKQFEVLREIIRNSIGDKLSF